MKSDFQPPTARKKHSRVGLISFGLAMTTGALGFLLFVISFIPERGTYTEQRFNYVFLIFALGISPFLHLTGLVMGIVSAFDKNSRKVFPVLGIVFNLLPLIVVLSIWIILFGLIVALISSGGGWV